ncbi:hypothetical protein CPB86DRAFT_306959 [Serendipita vermifera]|nr:hypothetical protein CPB86DRAFT_306959 [Serendipita vermifera]
MDRLTKNTKGSNLNIQNLLKRFKLNSKHPDARASIVNDYVIETNLDTVPAAAVTVHAEKTAPESLLTLPSEVLEYVCIQLHPLDVVKCRRICTRFKELIESSVELRLRIDLAIDGYLLGYRGTSPAKDVREFHEQRRNALENMQCFASWTESIAPGDFGHLEVSDGIFAQIFTDDPHGRVFKTLIYQELLPPQSRRKRWRQARDNLGIGFVDFSFWMQGDLQAIMEPRDNDTYRRIHFRTISTNEVHPNSAAPYVDVFRRDCPIWEHCYSIAYEDRIAYGFLEETGALRTGFVVDCAESKVIMPCMPLADLAFLSKEEALLLFNGQGDHRTSISVYSFSLQRIICECQLPFPYIPYRAVFLTRPESRLGEKRPTFIAKSLLPDPDLNIIGMNFQVNPQDNDSYVVVMSLQGFSQIYKALLDKYPHRHTFEWEEWGPTVTRWLPYGRIMSTGYRNIFGSRFLVEGYPDSLHHDSYNHLTLLLLDFNPRPIRRGVTTSVSGGSQAHRIVIEEETTTQLACCDKVIKSSLPFRAFTTPWRPSCFNFQFDGSTIIGKTYSQYEFYSFLPLEPSERPEEDTSVVKGGDT